MSGSARLGALCGATALAALFALGLAGCTKKVVAPAVANQRPTVRLVQYPSVRNGTYGYSYTMRWVGFDPDGEVRGFRYVVDPPTPIPARPQPDTTWVSTTDTGASFTFTASTPETGSPSLSSDYHVFVIEAVDNRGLWSLPTIAAFNSQTIAPSVNISSPAPKGPSRLFTTPSLDISWVGRDPDGINGRGPVSYRTILLTTSSEVPPLTAIAYPDTLRRLYQPRGWAGWDSLGGDVTSQHFSNLVPLQDYAFCVIAFDEAGAYTPVVTDATNLLFFRPLIGQGIGPRLTVSSDFFSYTYRSSTYLPGDPSQQISVEVADNAPVTLNWSATVSTGTTLQYYRWVLDPADLEDNTPRSNERTDLNHWSVASPLEVTATIPPLGLSTDHYFYIEAADAGGLKSLGQVHLRPIAPIFDRPLLILDDTRMLTDQRSPQTTGCIDPPLGRWPTAAELDTFLYARGGVPIKCYPAGSVSRPGVFSGYDYDTLGTQAMNVAAGVPLSQLVHYTHLVWVLDGVSALIEQNTFGFSKPVTALRAMSAAGRANTLASYVRLGGQAWMTGGGCMVASLEPWNNSSNDRPRLTFSSSANEIVPGRFAYDFVHWRSQIQQSSGGIQITQSLGRLSGTPGIYATMPAQLQYKSPAAGDSMPAWRVNPGEFYSTTTDIEALTLPNSILEDQSPSPLTQDLESELDTLYVASGGGLTASPIMTVYHGRDNTPVVMTGFNLWSFRRSQLVQLVDAVLQGMWGMPKHAPVTALRGRGTLPAAIVQVPIGAGGAAPPAALRGAAPTPALRGAASAPGRAGQVAPAASVRSGTAAYPPVWRPRPASR